MTTYLIIEGTDGVGKTTIARQESKKLRATYRHTSRPSQTTWMAEYVDPVISALERGMPMVLDRWHLGELVWPEVFGRPSLFTRKAEFDACNLMLAQVGARMTVLVRDPAEIEHELRSRGETEQQIANSLLGQELYHQAVARVKYLPTTVVNSSTLIRVPA